MSYEIFDHTADIGLRVKAKDLNGLFRDAAEGFYSLVTDPQAIQASKTERVQEVEMNFQEENAAELFMHWLQEILFFFSSRKLILRDINFISLTPMILKCRGRAVLFDPARHLSRHEVKAVTYHQFRVLQTPGGWEAEVIFDI
jgi:SHS2 domain-containing protein